MKLVRSEMMTKIQKDKIKDLISRGAKQDPDVARVVWFLGRCIMVKEDGEIEEL